jgi:hypothetical protein
VTQKWTVGNQTRVGIYSKRDVLAGEELTYNYNFLGFWKDGKGHRCCCGSRNCSGFFGQRPLKLKPKSDASNSKEGKKNGSKHNRPKSDVSDAESKSRPSKKPKKIEQNSKKVDVKKSETEVPDFSSSTTAEMFADKPKPFCHARFFSITEDMPSVRRMGHWIGPLLNHPSDPYQAEASAKSKLHISISSGAKNLLSFQ